MRLPQELFGRIDCAIEWRTVPSARISYSQEQNKDSQEQNKDSQEQNKDSQKQNRETDFTNHSYLHPYSCGRYVHGMRIRYLQSQILPRILEADVLHHTANQVFVVGQFAMLHFLP